MGLLRYGDPIGKPETDMMVRRGIRYELDTIWTGRNQAYDREAKLQLNGRIVYVLDRFATPEEAHQHLNTPEHPDGRFTHVWEVWVAKGRAYYRKKKTTSKPKTKRDTSDELLDGILTVTKAAVIGGVGLGVVGALGATLRKKSRKIKPKVKKDCGCKK